ncbi:MAG TPA: PEGA domain-containing protein, partial [Polyangiaceae bacterium]|nr:PEGA domain-containing protein [Polyangiaceae bacterium]
PAFEGTTLPSVCASIAADPPAALRLKRPEVPAELEVIVLKCLEKDPARRFQSARERAGSLAPFAGRAESGQRSSPLGDATIRSSPMLMSLAELRDKPTLALSEMNPGTMASAVLTQSGERVISKGEAERSRRDAASAAEASESAVPSSAGTPEAAAPKHSRLLVGAALIAALGVLIWALRPSHDAPLQVVAPASATTPASATPPSPRAFAVQIDSSPSGASVYEGEQLLGSTPMQLSVDSGSVASLPRTFTVRKAGYLPYTIMQGNSAKDVHLFAELVQDQAGASTATAKPKKPALVPAPHASPKPQGDIFMQR